MKRLIGPVADFVAVIKDLAYRCVSTGVKASLDWLVARLRFEAHLKVPRRHWRVIVRSAGLTCLTCHSTCRPLTAMIGHSAWRTCRNSLILQTHKPQRHNPALSLSHSPSLKIPPTAVKLTTTTSRQPRPWHLTRPISLWWWQAQAQGLVPVRVQAPPSTAQRRQTTLEGDCLRSCNQRPENNYVLTTCSGAAQPLMQHPRQLSRSVHPPSLS